MVPSRSSRSAGRARRGSAEDLFEELTDRMANENVAFLNAGRGARRHAKTDVAETAHLATVLAGQTDHGHLLFTCGLDRAHDVAAVAAGRDREEHIPGAPVGAHLAR